MSQIRFNQVFVGLLFLSFISAFFVPTSFTDPLRCVEKLFSPIAWPARKIASAARNRFDPPTSIDHRSENDVKAENARLRTLVLNLSGQLDEIRRINKEFDNLGPLRPFCTRFRVNGNDPSSSRQSLSISATTFDGVEPRMPVISSIGLVGRVERVGPAGAQVQLITDPTFGASARFVNKKNEVLKTEQPYVIGAGKGMMQINNIRIRETKGNVPGEPDAGVDIGDFLVLDDPEWPLGLKNYILGTVVSIDKQPKAPTIALIRVRPLFALSTVREVMVVNRTSADESARTANSIEPPN